MSTPVFVDPEISTQADGAQSSRVPVPLPEDPYEAIRQTYLVEADTESEPIEDLVETEIPESPHIVASPTSLPDSTPSTCHVVESEDSDTSSARSTSSDSTAPLLPDHPLTHTTPALVPSLCRTARMAVHVPPAMSPSLSASIAEVATMSDSAFRKRFRSSYDSSPSSSPPDLPSRKCYQGTFELVEDDEEEEDDQEEDDEEEDEEIEERNEAILEGQQRAAPVVETVMGEPLGLGYKALRRREIVLEEGRMPSVFKVGQSSGSVPKPKRPERVSALWQTTLTTWIDPEDGISYIDVPAYPPPAPPVQTLPSLEWSSGSLPVSPTPSIVSSPVSSPMIPLIVPSPAVSPDMAETEGFLTELGAQVEMQGGLICDHTIRLGD
ncbi:hypothetical protein Tco_0679327 [Tanacetum coccineum]|uniref:Uncharacterized protein n=1 Tax=Tanacetum coccineum TaxID=301880 RepID=A0ABQ4XIG7_9ASTR